MISARVAAVGAQLPSCVDSANIPRWLLGAHVLKLFANCSEDMATNSLKMGLFT